jgi:hypothetical protein
MFISDITEAISLTKYTKTIEKSFNDGIQNALKTLSERGDDEYFYKKEQAEYASEHGGSNEFREAMYDVFSEILKVRLSEQLTKDLKKLKIGVTNVKFKYLPETISAHVLPDSNIIEINQSFLKYMSELIIDRLMESVMDNIYYPEEKAIKFFEISEKASQKDNHWFITVVADARKLPDTIREISSVIVHELVHVVQHHSQRGREGFDTEYRSYLDKKKGEFYNLASGSRSSNEDSRYDKLYYASPQEITAFAHQFALGILRSWDVDNAESVDQLPTMGADGVDHKEIVASINRNMVRKFNNPDNPQEMKVYKRYLKLIYQEVIRGLEAKKEELLKKSQKNS